LTQKGFKSPILVYQIFPDRFAIGTGLDSFAKLSEPPYRRPYIIPRAWNEKPQKLLGQREYFGGDLWGIVERLDHIVDLGASTLYLTPIFKAHSCHKYDTEDFREVEPQFGGEEAFDALVAACMERSMGLVLDGVFNHVGVTHPWYIDMLKLDGKSRYGFRKDPQTAKQSFWRGVRTLPELDLTCPNVRGELFTHEDSILRHWLRRGATGWRLDCARWLGMEVCSLIRQIVKDENAMDGTIGEIMGDPIPCLQEDAFDGVMNYAFRNIILDLLTGKKDITEATNGLNTLVAQCPEESLLKSWTMLGSHDTPRLLTVLEMDRKKARLARALQFAFSGAPIVYYGDEIGLCGGDDPDNRAPMPWDRHKWDEEILKQITVLAKLRQKHTVLLMGKTTFIDIKNGLGWIRWMYDAPDAILLLANPDTERSLNIDINRILKVSPTQTWIPQCQVWPEHSIYEKPSILKITLSSLEVKWIQVSRKKGA